MRTLLLVPTLVAGVLAVCLHAGARQPSSSSCAFTAGGRTVGCEVVVPSGPGRHPAAILLHGRAGMDVYGPRLREQAEGLVKRGFVVMIPRYFEATGDSANPDVTAERFAAWSAALTGAIDRLAAHPAVDPQRIAVSGLSLGGYLAGAVAQTDERIRVLASFFAGLSQYAPQPPRRLPPSVIVHADRDPIVPLAEARKMANAIAALDIEHELHVYPAEEHLLDGGNWKDAIDRVETFFLRWVGDEIADLPALRRVFDDRQVTGTTVVYDVRAGTYSAVHAERAARRLIPASTFKVFNSLVALDLGLVRDGATVLPWDGRRHERTELNRDLDLRTAFALSAVPHYQALARRAGPERMQDYLSRVGYGNGDISGGIDQFWLEGGLRISPIEQVQFLTRLRRGDLPFSAHAMAVTRELMRQEQKGDVSLHAKTGWARQGSRQVGWWVGWASRGADVRVFATVLESPTPRGDFGPLRLTITRDVLSALGLPIP